MIVVDTNTIAYLYLHNEMTEKVERLLTLDSLWVAPLLWRSEMRNILALYIRKQILSLEMACHIQDKAEALMEGNEYTLDSVSILSLAEASNCSAYDCEFIALAKVKHAPLITADKKLLSTFPDIAITPKEYVLKLAEKRNN
jgi:predicted nucleic acid-binding protein